MRCANWEERIALYAGGDLDAGAAAGVERHLRECAECRAYAEEMRESLEMLRGAHAEEIPATAFTAVRARVAEQLARPRRRWAWAWAAAAAVVVLAAAGIGLRRPERRVVQVAPPVAAVRNDVGQALPPANRWQTAKSDGFPHETAAGWQAEAPGGSACPT